MRRWWMMLVSAAMLAAGPVKAIEVVVPPPVALVPLPPGAKPKPISMTRLAANIAPGTPWADEALIGSPIPLPCIVDRGAQVSRWKEANNQINNLEPWDRVLRQELSAAGFTASGDPTNLFEQRQTSDLQLGALITDLRLQSCSQTTIAGSTYGGSTVMTVEWQVYSVIQNRVVARITTRGGVVVKPGRNATSFDLIGGAFGDNVRRLTVDPRFRELVTATAEATAALAPSAIRFAAASERISVSTAARSVVAVFAGDGHGSGLVISPDGYILTNHHVSGSTGQVRVRWPDGSESVGQVVKADPRRDVALIKTEAKAAALPLRRTPAQLGEPVYAIGTPLSEQFQGSVTKGIVSASRTYEGQTYIQSDAVVNGGNSGGPLIDESGAVIGITVAGMEIGGAPVGINLFIPIEDALKALALTPAPAT